MSLFPLHPYRIFSVYAEFYADSCFFFFFFSQQFTNVPWPLTLTVLGKKSSVMQSLSPPKGKKEQHTHTHTHTNRCMFKQLNHFAIHLKLTQHDFVGGSAVLLLSHVWLFETHGLQHARLLCPPLSPRVCSHSSPLSQWCYLTVSSSAAPFSSCPQSFPASGFFSSESALHIRWPKNWSFSISNSPSNEYRIDWLDLLAVQGTLKSLLQHHSSKSLVLRCPAFFMVQLSPLYMTAGKIIALIIQTFTAKWCLCFLICCLGLSQLSFQGASIF